MNKFASFEVKDKHLVYNTERILDLNKFSIFLILALTTVSSAFSQSQDSVVVDNPEYIEFDKDTIPIPVINISDSLPLSQADSVAELLENELDQQATDTLQAEKPRGDITTTVNYKAKDSISLNMKTKYVEMYGEAAIDYKPIRLEAEVITVNWNTNTMEARSRTDSLGNEIGKPVFKNNAEVYETNNLKYNFKTEKAIISGLVTSQGEGFVQGSQVFKDKNNQLYIPYTKYTTCNLANPHFYIAARNVKIIPGNKLVSGPFNMVVNEVPTPLGFFFGMFPENKERTSGIIFPSYGEQRLRGFYLENGGYFFAINDYMNLAITGNLYSKGGYGVNAYSQYTKRYKYSGNFTFNYSRLVAEDVSSTEKDITNDFRIAWSHRPQSKGTGRFSANVNAATTTYNQNNRVSDVNDQINATLSSNVSYTKTFRNTPISAGVNARFNQSLRTGRVDLILPDFSVNVNNIYPFQRKTGGAKTWYDRLVFRYTMSGSNQITNQVSADSIAPFNAETIPELAKRARNGIKHDIPISTSLKLLKHFTLSPSFNYSESWYSSKLNYTYDEDLGTFVTDTIPGFNRVYQYNTGAGINTRLYGTYFTNKEFGFQAIRHVMNPSFGYSWRPDFSEDRFGYYQEVQVDESGNTDVKSRYAGYLYGTPGSGRSSSLSFSLSNTLEIKVRSRKDTTGKSQKIPLLKNFGLSTSYNFLADSFNLTPISLRANTSMFNGKDIFNGAATTTGLNINWNGTLDPYVYLLDSINIDDNGNQTVYQRRISTFSWNNGDGIGRLINTTVNLSAGFRAKPRKGAKLAGQDINNRRDLEDALESGRLNFQEVAIVENILSHPENYVNFNIPWSLNFTYSLNFRRVGFEEGTFTQTLRFNGDMNLTPKWKITFSSGYDFEAKELTQTNFSIVRDLHCWELAFSWVPFGRFTSYDLTIRAKSSLLQDLKVNRTRRFQDNVFF